MKIHGMTVCVDYADMLEKSIGAWMSGLESLMIVTSTRDYDTPTLAMVKGADFVRTNSFYLDGAAFNKGRAQQEAWPSVPKDDWLLLFDADIVPPADWRLQLEALPLNPGYLYGCFRYDEHGVRIKDDSHGYGYFQLFHASDDLAQVDPFFDTYWTHAGNGDSNIMLRWRNVGRLAPVLPLKLLHSGGPSHNWYGRGKHAEFQAMERERMRRGGGWESLEGEKLRK
jgi:hypothetical protein